MSLTVLSRRHWLHALALLTLPSHKALAQPVWPSRPVRLIVPYPSGGVSDQVARWLAEEQKQAVLDRDFQRMLDLGGNVYFLSKIFAAEGMSYVQAVSTMTDMTTEEYQAMMLAGGRSPDGWRSKKERGEA